MAAAGAAAAAGRGDLLLHALANADGDRPHFLARHAHVVALRVGVRNHPGLADVLADLLLLGDATGAADRALNLTGNRLVGAALDGAGLANLDALADRHRAANGFFARDPALDRLGLRALAAAAAAAIVVVVLVAQAADAIHQARAARNFAAFPVSVINALGAHLGALLGAPMFLHDRLFGPARNALANATGFHALLGDIPLAAHGPHALLGVVFATAAGADLLTLFGAVGGAANLALLLHPNVAIHSNRARSGAGSRAAIVAVVVAAIVVAAVVATAAVAAAIAAVVATV